MDFDLSSCIGFVTNSATKNITEDFNRRLEKCGSTRIQWIALYFLDKAEAPVSQKDLAEKMSIKDSSLARLVDRMERDGLVRRVETDTDKRVRFLELTDTGRKTFLELLPIGVNFSDLLLNGIDEEEVKTFNNILEKMLKNIEKL